MDSSKDTDDQVNINQHFLVYREDMARGKSPLVIDLFIIRVE